jgi:MFS family permease
MPDLAPPAAAERVSAAAWGTLALLTALNVLNFVDRTLIASLAPLLIDDLELSRAEIGLLAGFGFVVFYSLVGLLLGLAADRWPRLTLMAIGLGLWSAMTALSGLARGFVHLAIPRALVGVGEATLTPAALSVLGDVFPRSRLALASGVYYAGIPLGTAASLFVAGSVAPRWGWRACFYLLGAIGVVAAAAIALFREPPRRGVAAAGARPPFGALARDVVRAVGERPTLALALLGGALLTYGAAAAIHTVTWLVQERGYSFGDAAFAAGFVAVAAGLLGNLAGGAFADACARRWRNGRLWSLVAMTAFFVPVGAVFYSSAPGTALFHLSWFVTSAGTTAWFGPLFAVVQEEAPPRARSSTVAFALLTVNLLGVGPGPFVTGLVGDVRDLSTGLLASLGVTAAAVVPFALAARWRPASSSSA